MKRPSFQFYPKDLLADTEAMAMPNEALGMYFKLLAYDWVNDGIPKDDKTIMRIVGFEWADFQGNMRETEDYEIVLSHLHGKLMAHPSKEGFLTNPRLQKEREKQDDFVQKKIDAGREGAKKRWAKPKKDQIANDSTPIVLPMANDSSSSSSAIINPPTPQGEKLQGGEKEKIKTQALAMLAKWFRTMHDVDDPFALAQTYLAKYPPEKIIKALKNSTCTSRIAFGKLLA